jgi:hypothetical protein
MGADAEYASNMTHGECATPFVPTVIVDATAPDVESDVMVRYDSVVTAVDGLFTPVTVSEIAVPLTSVPEIVYVMPLSAPAGVNKTCRATSSVAVPYCPTVMAPVVPAEAVMEMMV